MTVCLFICQGKLQSCQSQSLLYHYDEAIGNLNPERDIQCVRTQSHMHCTARSQNEHSTH